MPIHNRDIAALFDEMADLLEIDDAQPFRIRAYRNGARVIGELHREVREMIAHGEELIALPGIGKELARKMEEIVASGHCSALDQLHHHLPHGLVELLALPGLGPKRVRTLYRELHLHSPGELLAAARDGRLHALPGFGEKTERHIIEALERPAARRSRITWAEAENHLGPLLVWLRAATGTATVEAVGDFRRGCDSIAELELLAITARPAELLDRLAAYDEVVELHDRTPYRLGVTLRSLLPVELRVVPEESLGAARHYHTGSHDHLLALRRLAQPRGLKLNEYGVFLAGERGRERIAGDSEGSVYAALGLPYIEPELREGCGEIEAAHAGLLPRRLLEPGDLHGSLHNHTTWSDGRDTLEAMALAARERGHEYLAVTDHSKVLRIVNGLDTTRLLQQLERIDELNQRLEGITLLKGIEVDILEDGSLDLPLEVLRRLDLVVGSIHLKLDLPPRKQTERILKAMDSPCFTLLAHPSQRLMGEREGMAIDLPRIIRHARQRGCFLELNGTPRRLDLNDRFCRMAREEGVLIAVNADAHATGQLDHLRYGVNQARRGWLERRDVLNSRPLQELRPLLRGTMA